MNKFIFNMKNTGYGQNINRLFPQNRYKGW